MEQDLLGKDLDIGDIVVRPKFSTFTFHKILKFTKKRIVLSVKRQPLQYSVNSKVYILDDYLYDTHNPEEVENHNSYIYINRSDKTNNNLLLWKKHMERQ